MPCGWWEPGNCSVRTAFITGYIVYGIGIAIYILYRYCYTGMIATNQILQSDNEVGFIRFCAISAMLSAVTTFLLWLLPKLYTPPETFEAGVMMYTNLYYIIRLWVNFIHTPLALK